jgi:hypothetical protein
MHFLHWIAIAVALAACSVDSEKPGSDSPRDTSGLTPPDTEEPDTEDTDLPDGTDAPGTLDTANGCPFESLEEARFEPLAGQSGRTETDQSSGYTDDYLYDDSEYIKIGVRQDWGGSVVFFGLADGNSGSNASNTIDANDPGREVQFAIYDPDRLMQGCAHDASCRSGGTSCGNSIRYLGWNPVQGGNRCGDGSGVENVHHTAGLLHTESRPLHWNPDWDSTNCASDSCTSNGNSARQSNVLVTQKARFVRTHVVELSYAVENLDSMDHANQVQEMPTLYTANGNSGPDLWRLMDASGQQIDINEPANDGFFQKTFSSAEPWVSLQNDGQDYGVGILYENGLLDFQGWQNRDLPFNNVRALFDFGLGPNATVEARAYLILGGYNTVKNEAGWLQDNLGPFGRIESPQGILDSEAVTISGWAQDNRSVVTVDAIIDDWLTVPLNYGASRDDVCAHWPGYSNCGGVGFSGSFDAAQLGWQKGCAHKIEVRAVDSDGNARIIDRKAWTIH